MYAKGCAVEAVDTEGHWAVGLVDRVVEWWGVWSNM